MRCVALALNVFGVLVAMWGVADLAGELGEAHPARVLLAWLKDGVRRLLRRTKPESGSVDSGMSSATMIGSGTTYAPTLPDAPIEQRVAALEAALTSVRDDIAQESQLRAMEDHAIRSALDREARERKAADENLTTSVRRLIGGEEGRGLALTWLGLGLTLVGTVLGGLVD